GRTGRMNNAGYVVNLGDDHDFRKLKKMIAPVEVKQVYFKGYQLVTEKPLPKAKDKKVVSMSETKKKGKKKNRWKKQKNKGYHAKKQDK
ncbi:MAG: ATP-dependent helicase, partial [Lactobacillus iners]|nr:ATP-dependent helicase [Lactobacillus iners]